ncbi:hypothetical protein CYMTET_52583 [Cymbomonas tetramitiformis]|uniref:Pyruvate kinase n=1 Tax=Cymbomonas tetramitiformis TaxID=36881 RepID=A0AAE0ERH5_9CHLO|nr:hypothetical protein CYMTET_52583 [Cymbomonas tetramitiformis]
MGCGASKAAENEGASPEKYLSQSAEPSADKSAASASPDRAVSASPTAAHQLASRSPSRIVLQHEENVLNKKVKFDSEWQPEYRPHLIVPPSQNTVFAARRSTRLSDSLFSSAVPESLIKGKIMCTLGPACSEEGQMFELLSAGMNIARFQLSQGNHKSQQQLLDRFRSAVSSSGCAAATLLDTQGPEITVGRLDRHEPIYLETGDTMVVRGCGPEEFASFVGYRNEEETKVAVSYERLCQQIKPGDPMWFNDGQIKLEVKVIRNECELEAKVLNPRVLTEHSTVGLPSLRLDLPVLSPKDVADVQAFCSGDDAMDFLALSFTQSAEDVAEARRVLDAGGGKLVRIIAKIETALGLANFDAILRAADGIYVDRGDLGMNIPMEKVALATKMMVAKCNIAGKPSIVAGNILQSMGESKTPSHPEMSDVANLIIDGCETLMLDRETAYGLHPLRVVSELRNIIRTAALGIDFHAQMDFIRRHYVSQQENNHLTSLLCSVATSAVEYQDTGSSDGTTSMILVLTRTGAAADLVSMFHPPCTVLVASEDPRVLRQTTIRWAQHGWRPTQMEDLEGVISEACEYIVAKSFCKLASKLIVVSGVSSIFADDDCTVQTITVPGVQPGDRTDGADELSASYDASKSLTQPLLLPRFLSSTTLSDISQGTERLRARKTKLICTIGPRATTAQQICGMLDAGLDAAYFDFSIGAQSGYKRVLQLFREQCAKKAEAMRIEFGATCIPSWPTMMATRGTEVKTTKLQNHKRITLTVGQTIKMVVCDDDDLSFEGYQTEEETKIGLAYACLCGSVRPGDLITISRGNIVVKVTQILGRAEVHGVVTKASIKLGEKKPFNIPGNHVEKEVLSEKDLKDLKFCIENNMDALVVPFTQTDYDVRSVREALDAEGGHGVKIIASIDTIVGLQNLNSILLVADGIMCSRERLACEVHSEKIGLAQKMVAARCNIAGKLAICTGEMLDSMYDSPMMTAAEVCDVTNAVLDGFDACLLTQVTLVGEFPVDAISQASKVARFAELGVDYYGSTNFISNNTRKPMAGMEAICLAAVTATIDMDASLIIIFSDSIVPPRLIAKFRPQVTILVVTNKPQVAAHCRFVFGLVPMYMKEKVTDTADALPAAVMHAKVQGLVTGESLQVIVMSGRETAIMSGQGIADLRFAPQRVTLQGESVLLVDPLPSPEGSYQGDQIMTLAVLSANGSVLENPSARKRNTKILCQLGPKSRSKDAICELLDAGMDVACINLAIGSQAGWMQVMADWREILAARLPQSRHVATMMVTKGPEIKTTMLRGHKRISLTVGQTVTIVVCGDDDQSFEGFQTEEETKIGVAYGALAESVAPGSTILISNGSIAICVKEVAGAEVQGVVTLADMKLGEKKLCSLPGARIQMPVLTPQDKDSVLNFACTWNMDYLAVTFTQSGEDIKHVRALLQEAGCSMQVLAKIQNAEGLRNIDDILRHADGVIMARSALGVEIGAEKVGPLEQCKTQPVIPLPASCARRSTPAASSQAARSRAEPLAAECLSLIRTPRQTQERCAALQVPGAQKLIVTKCGIACKFVAVGDQMMETMLTKQKPTRAEMTDAANMVFDRCDGAMLVGETAHSTRAAETIRSLAAILVGAEEAMNKQQIFSFIRDFTPKPVGVVEAVVSGAVKTALDIEAFLIVIHSQDGSAAVLAAKYRPKVPVLVMTESEAIARQLSARFSLQAYLLPPGESYSAPGLKTAVAHAIANGICGGGGKMVLVSGRQGGAPPDQAPSVEVADMPDSVKAQPAKSLRVSALSITNKSWAAFRSQTLDVESHTAKTNLPCRKAKIVCTIGPQSGTEEVLGRLLDAGLNLARFNFSSGKAEQHRERLNRLRAVASSRGAHVATIFDTEGPEVVIGRLERHEPIYVEAGQKVILRACGGEEMRTFVGSKTDEATRIAVSYPQLSAHLTAGNVIWCNGHVDNLGIRVTSILDSCEVEGEALNSMLLAEGTTVSMPDITLDLPVLSPKDVADVQAFCSGDGAMDFLALSFTQSAEDVAEARRVLDAVEGGERVRIIAKIETALGLANFDAIMWAADGVMVDRGDLGMNIPMEKVALATKMMVAKCNIAGKFVICAAQMMEFMVEYSTPSCSEMTDVANAVLDGFDTVMLSAETAYGNYPEQTVRTMAALVRQAEVAMNFAATCAFIHEYSKPLSTCEAVALGVVNCAIDSKATLIICISDQGFMASLISKYRPPVPVLLVTSQAHIARQANAVFAQYPLLVPNLAEEFSTYLAKAVDIGVYSSGTVLAMYGRLEPDADSDPKYEILPPTECR